MQFIQFIKVAPVFMVEAKSAPFPIVFFVNAIGYSIS